MRHNLLQQLCGLRRALLLEQVVLPSDALRFCSLHEQGVQAVQLSSAHSVLCVVLILRGAGVRGMHQPPKHCQRAPQILSKWSLFLECCRAGLPVLLATGTDTCLFRLLPRVARLFLTHPSLCSPCGGHHPNHRLLAPCVGCVCGPVPWLLCGVYVLFAALPLVLTHQL